MTYWSVQAYAFFLFVFFFLFFAWLRLKRELNGGYFIKNVFDLHFDAPELISFKPGKIFSAEKHGKYGLVSIYSLFWFLWCW